MASGAQAARRSLTPGAVPASPCNPKGLGLACVDSAGKKIAGLKAHLTFDDGPAVAIAQGNGKERNNTRAIMEILKERKAPATFFVMGDKIFSDNVLPGYGSAKPSVAAQNLEMLKELKQNGFRIASHTFHHIPHRDLKFSEQQIRDNLTKSLRPPLDELFDRPELVRMPYGQCWYRESGPSFKARCQRVMDQVSANDQIHVGWNVDSEDWKRLPQKPGELQPMLDAVSRELCEGNGGVVLFHDIQNVTVNHLACIIDELKGAGIEFVGIEDPVIKAKRTGPYKVLDPGSKPGLLDALGPLQPKPASSGTGH